MAPSQETGHGLYGPQDEEQRRQSSSLRGGLSNPNICSVQTDTQTFRQSPYPIAPKNLFHVSLLRILPLPFPYLLFFFFLSLPSLSSNVTASTKLPGSARRGDVSLRLQPVLSYAAPPCAVLGNGRKKQHTRARTNGCRNRIERFRVRDAVSAIFVAFALAQRRL